MSNHAQIDQNNKPTWLAYNETTGEVETVYVDPITDALLIYAVSADSNTPTSLNTMGIDANERPTQGAYNQSTGTVEALRCGSGGELLITVV